jgi:Domain of unknown function (DUF4351)
MSKNPFDQFCKQILEAFLTPFGTVKISREVPGEARLIDVWFEPSGTLPLPEEYGLLRQIAATACLIEPFRKQPSMIEVYSCKEKLFAIFGELQRQAVRDNRSIPDSCEGLPWLWILASSASDNLVLNRLEMTPDPDWMPGIYFDHADRTALISINKLPWNEETLWIRLLGKGKAQESAIREVRQLPLTDPRRDRALELLATWKISLEITQAFEEEEQSLMVQLTEAYLEWKEITQDIAERKGLRKGRREGQVLQSRSIALRQLTRRFGPLPVGISAAIETLSLPQLEDLSDALLDFTNVADLQTWLSAAS